MISEPLTLSTSNPVLAAKGLTRRFGGLIAVNDVSFTVQKHEILGLIGPNGAGKTTLFNVMTGLIPASSGNLIYQNENISQLRPYQIANKGIARTFQNIRLLGNFQLWKMWRSPDTSTVDRAIQLYRCWRGFSGCQPLTQWNAKPSGKP